MNQHAPQARSFRLFLALLFLVPTHLIADITGTYWNKPPSIMHSFNPAHFYSGRINGRAVEGVWEQGSEVCAPFIEASVKIYADTGQCCLAIKTLGNRYVFSKVLFSGDYRGKLYKLCNHSVMEKQLDVLEETVPHG